MNLGNPIINIIPIGFVDEDARPWIIYVKCNIIIHENYDVFIFQPSFLKNLICMAYISLQNQ